MREILFRGKRKDNGEWVEGYLLRGGWYYNDEKMTVIVPINNIFYPRCKIGSWEEVIPETIGQFVGLLDKHGKKIFEGDIVKNYDHMYWGDVKPVSFYNGRYYPFIFSPEYTSWNNELCEIIGNIHDNPELISHT